VIGWGRRPGVGGGECGTPAARGLIKDKIGLKFEVVLNPSEIRCIGQRNIYYTYFSEY